MKNSPILAVSHSMYIRMLLGVCMNTPLAQAALIKQKNGCINVIDIDVKGRKKKISSKSKVFGGPLNSMKKENDFSFEFPLVHVIRMNEIRHLEGLD